MLITDFARLHYNKNFPINYWLLRAEDVWDVSLREGTTVEDNSPLKICFDLNRTQQRRFSPGSARSYQLRFDKQIAILYSASLLSLSYHQATCPSRRNRSATRKNDQPKIGDLEDVGKGKDSRTYLKHVGVLIFLVLDDDGLISR